ncbi:GDSL esterase/lipase 5 [Dorcoceras hygrometricum]|uniref:GDSL esterase/lipase 5 n=1 Tax=Dorcoceras hygrometricum TaxID=472368 RepID=A0A2Z7AZS2_9LAMI|nr:GDSL esterase/lipase 5 [Dorcoceras hygrometricum]
MHQVNYMAISTFFLIFTCALLVPFRPSTASFQHCPNRTALFIFGDSFFDTGNNNYINTTSFDQANFWPYGETYFNYPTGRFSDGRLIIDFIVIFIFLAEHAKLPMIRPYLQPRNEDWSKNYHGVNFASAGAGALTETFQGSVIDLKSQLGYYNVEAKRLKHRLNHDAAKDILTNAVYFFSIGTNDYTIRFLLNSTAMISFTRSQYVGMVIGNLTMVIQVNIRKGGRKFGFLNLGDLGCLPGLRILDTKSQDGCLEEASSLATLHNSVLAKSLSEIQMKLHGFKYFLYDFNRDLAQKVHQPSNYGLTESKKACCGTGSFNGIFSCGGKRLVKEFELCENPDEFIFWDSYHLTENVYRQMADHMWGGDQTGKSTLKSFFQ